MLSSILCMSQFLFSENNKIQGVYLFQSGLEFKHSFIETKVFANIESSAMEDPTYTLTSWGLGIQPFDFLSLKLGSITYSGIWSRFNNPSPSKISPLKHAYSVQQKLLAAMPTKNTINKPLSIMFDIDFPFLTVQTFSTLEFSQELLSGAGITVPFRIKKKDTSSEDFLSGNWTLAWKMTSLHTKENNSWFMNDIYFQKDYFHTFIQEASFKTKSNTLLISSGLSQMPFSNPGLFFRTDYSLTFKAFLLNTHIFLSDIDYLTQSGSFERDTIQVSVNPQLRFNYYGGLLRSFKIGGTSKFVLNNGENSFDSPQWLMAYDLSSEINILFLSFFVQASISDLFLPKRGLTRENIIQKESLVNLRTKIIFKPWYFQKLPRTWLFQVDHERAPLNEDKAKKIALKTEFITAVPIHTTIFKIQIYNEAEINIKNKIELSSLPFGLQVDANIKPFSTQSKTKIKASSQIEVNVKKDTLISELAVILEL